MAFSPETFALLMGKIKGLASGISSVAVGSNKQSLVFTTTNGTTVTVGIPNPINTVELCNKLSIDASNHLLYDGKRIAEYTEIPTATSQLSNDSGFITSSDLPTIPSKVSELTNDSKFITKTDMDTAIADAVTGGTIDLSDYQLKEDNALETTNKTIVGAINELKKSGSGSGSGEGLTDEQKQQLADAYAHSQSPHVSVSDIPTNVSELNNDSGYLTTNDITIPTKVSDLTNDSNFIDKEVNNLTNYPTTATVENTYAKKTDIPTIPTKVSQLSNDSGFITSIPTEYVTDTELNAKGYLTEHQDISGLQLKSDIGLTTTDKTVVGGINEVKVTADNKSKIITLTESQYKALSNLDPETYYITTDDSTNISTTINVNSTDKEVPSAKVVYTELNKKVNKTDIVDNLTSTNIDKPLSANQGKILKDELSKKLDIEEANIVNLIPFPYDFPTIHKISGITFKVDDEGAIYVSGTKTKDTLVQYYPMRDSNGTNGYLIDTFEIGKTYTLSGCPSGGSASTYGLRIILNYDKSSEGLTPYQYIDMGTGVTFTIKSEIKYARLMIDYNGTTNTTYGNLVFKPQITEGNKVIDFKPSLNRSNLSQLGNTISSTINGLNSRIIIDSGENMDNITTVGFYRISTETTAQTILNLPISSACLIDVYGDNYIEAGQGWMVQEVKASNSVNVPIYRRSKVLNGSWGKWQKLCTTTVADVDWTKATATSKLTSGIINYRVKNGICYVRCSAISSATMSTPNEVIVKGMPIPEQTPDDWQSLAANNDCTASPFQNLLVRITPTGDLINYIGTNGAIYFGTFSYPVAES